MDILGIIYIFNIAKSDIFLFILFVSRAYSYVSFVSFFYSIIKGNKTVINMFG
jgi:hypothetical protein